MAVDEKYIRSLLDVFDNVYDMQLSEDRQLGIELLASATPILVAEIRRLRGMPEPAAPIPITSHRRSQ